MERNDPGVPRFANGLEKKLPPVRGRLTPNAPLGHMTWFGVGGPAEVLFKPADKQDLIDFIKNCPREIEVTVLGVASNLIIRDGGIPGVVIRMGKEFSEIKASVYHIEAGAAALDLNVALVARKNAIAGLEFLSGIPGSIGGALRMNAGAYGCETKDVLVTAEVLFHDGTVRHMTSPEMGMRYRHNDLPASVIFLAATLKGSAGDGAAIEGRMADIKTKRAETQPIKSKTGGSTFANPEGAKAWQLIDGAGSRGLKIGGAEMSQMHANFMLNTGNATAADLERLGEEVRQRVYAKSKIMLEWEIRRVGIPLATDKDILNWMKRERS
ncbi:MAG: UDP-N-acetylmuramate dehydrogenase [Proteobacteria bacterium]|nr:UDP-N-acetylmuramate dehydrogenase [Pseudomonadota bacterium]